MPGRGGAAEAVVDRLPEAVARDIHCGNAGQAQTPAFVVQGAQAGEQAARGFG